MTCIALTPCGSRSRSFCQTFLLSASKRIRFQKFEIRSQLSFLSGSSAAATKYAKELEAAVDVVQKACYLCVDVQRQLLSKDKGILEKSDHTPVTVADFGVQALISMELSRLFPNIPIVAEEDSSQLMPDLENQTTGDISSSLMEAITNVVSKSVNSSGLKYDQIIKAIDRGKDTFSLIQHPTTYWVLDPIDGTRGFLRGSKALYVVGLALVEEGKPILGVMGCPNWEITAVASDDLEIRFPELGMMMVACMGFGTWMKKMSLNSDWFFSGRAMCDWFKCSVDGCDSIQDARYCIQDRETWENLILSTKLSETCVTEENSPGWNPTIIPVCCGSLCKYMMIASGRASVFMVQVAKAATVKAWDHAVGMICVSEAGGEVTSWDGGPLVLGSNDIERRTIAPGGGGILVTNGKLHARILEMFK